MCRERSGTQIVRNIMSTERECNMYINMILLLSLGYGLIERECVCVCVCVYYDLCNDNT